jgi:putative ABC transport system permease protein
VIKDFLGLILVATLIAWPLAYAASSQWLSGFAYRTSLSPVLFIAASGLAVAVAILTVSWQAWRAARMQPVKVLKYE